jgi:hypothetical protein
MSVDAGLIAPFLPLLLELAAVIGKNGLRKHLLLRQQAVVSTIVTSLGQTAHHKLTNHPQRACLPKRRAEKPNSLFHAQSICRRLNSYNFDAELDYEKTTGSKHQKTILIVATIAARIVSTKKSRLSRFMTAYL